MSGNVIKMDMTLAGVEELKENLRLLPERMRKPVIKRAMITLAKPMASSARNGVPQDRSAPHTKDKILVSGNLSRRQYKEAKAGMSGTDWKNTIQIYVGVGPSRKAHLIEFGTKPRYTKSGHFTGSMPAHPFMKMAFDSNASGFLTKLGPVLGDEIEKTATRYNKKLAGGKVSGYRSKKGG